MRTCLGREEYAEYLQQRIPNLITIKDVSKDPGGCFSRALKAAGGEPCVHLEDDIILTKGFVDKISMVIASRPEMVCQFFSMRKADLEVGSRVVSGANFLAAVCFYLPADMSRGVYNFLPNWERWDEHPTGLDLAVADYFKINKIKYYINIPNLVDHRVGKSVIDPRRSSKRVSKTFKEADL